MQTFHIFAIDSLVRCKGTIYLDLNQVWNNETMNN